MHRSKFLLDVTVVSFLLASACCDVTRDDDIRDALCQDFIKDKTTQDVLRAKTDLATPCACSEQIMTLDFTFHKVGNCYREWMFQEGVKQMCCYRSDGNLETGPRGGGYMELEDVSYNMSDVYRSCCHGDSGLCETFFDINLSDDCSRYRPPVTVRSFGDPTITTVDGKAYEFNGHGEYVFLKTKDIEIQARTGYIADGNKDATMFTAFAFEDMHSKSMIQLSFDRDKKSIDVYQNGNKLACNLTAPEVEPCQPMNGRCFILAGDNKMLPTGCSFNMIAKSVTFKSGELMSVEFNTKGINLNSTGLMSSTVNGQFVSRNGSRTFINASESAIFDFGETWSLQNSNESIFNYSISGQNFNYYNSNHTRPRFLEDLVGNIKELFKGYSSENITKFNKTCRNYWDSQTNTQCLLTIARTGDYSLGIAVMKDANETRRTWEIRHNSSPYFANNITTHSIITAIPHGNESSYSINLNEYAFDDDTNSRLRFDADTDIPSEDYTIAEGVFTWNFTDSLRSSTITGLRFIVFDQFNASSVHVMFIRYCGCEHGLLECNDFPEININTTTEHVVTATCHCEHYTGDYCEIRENPCDSHTCINGCDSSTEIGLIPCLPCNHGYEGDGTSCEDIDECRADYSGDDKCSQLCNNTIGSFICYCNHGYELKEDNHTCSDIDECLDNTKCSKSHHEICVNSPGTSACICMPGYMKKIEKGSCEEIGDGAMYVGAVTFAIAIIKTTEDINKTVDTPSNKLKMATTLDKMFKGTEGFISVEVYRLTIVLTTNSSGRKKRDTSSTDKLNVDYVVHWQTTNSTDAVIASLSAKVSSSSSSSSSPIYSSVIKLDDVCDVLASTVDVSPKPNNGTGSDVGLCSVPDKTDCDTLSTECQNKDGGFSCLCKSGFKPVKLSNKYCTDIDECVEDSNIKERCIDGHGSCVNQVGSWNCSCTSQRTWQDVGNVTYPVYRCQGNYSYIGVTRLVWRGDNDTQQIKLVIENELVSLYRNKSLEVHTYGLPISDLMVSATMLDFNQTSFDNGSIEVTAIFNLQMGEIVNVSRVADVISDVIPNVGQDNKATFKYFHIYDDSENMLCTLTDQGGCDVDSSMCEQQNGSTICTCRAGFKGKFGSDKFCSDINECEIYSSNETCSGLGECHNKHLGYSCTCYEGYFENATDPLHVTCQDIDECHSDKYICDMGTCKNTMGGWDCQCNRTGYIRTEISTSAVQCTDIDECHNSSYHCGGECTNTEGDWTCTCGQGYTVSINSNTNNTCEDINECSKNLGHCIGGKCVNNVGSWSCACNDSTYQPVNKRADTYRCMGDFQYVGEMNLVSLGEMNNKMIVDLFQYEIMSQFRTYNAHINLTSPSETVAMSDIFKTMDVLNILFNISGDPTLSIYRATVKYVIHIGEPLTFDVVNSTFATIPNLKAEDIKVSTNVIFKDNEYNLCHIENKTSCDQTTDCVVRRGSYRCVCKDGYTRTTDPSKCTNTNECEVKSVTCGGGGDCRDTVGNWTCDCNDTTEFHRRNDTYGVCEDKNECGYKDVYQCIGGWCMNKVNGWDCMCAAGYNASAITQDRVYSCNDQGHRRGSYRCVCKDGYTRTTYPSKCTNINECEVKSVTCGGGGDCRNTAGNWTCDCNDTTEFHRRNDTYGVCEDKNECDYKDVYKCIGGVCMNKVNGWDCMCAAGYNASAITQDRVYSCNDQGHRRGSYRCVCKDGYTRTTYPSKCTNINECEVKSVTCGGGGDCRNTAGNWTCDCNDTTEFHRRNDTYGVCEDKNECDYKDVYKCIGGVCMNKVNGWDCMCAAGYNASAITQDRVYSCNDIDECMDSQYVCSNRGTCKNTIGNWTCECPKGYNPVFKDIDECHGTSTLCQNGGTCVNSMGSYSCACPSGYDVTKLSNDTYTCQDINECTLHGKDKACMRALTCENTPGDWMCTCSDGLDAIVVNSSSKTCGGGYQYVATFSFILYKNVNNTVIFNKHLEQKLEDLYTHAYPRVWIGIEIVSDSVTGLTRNNTDKGVMVSARYIIQTVEPLNKTHVQVYYSGLKCPKGPPCERDEIGTNPIMFQDIVMSHNAAICNTSRNVCDTQSSNCVSNDGQLDCDCKQGFRKTLSNSFQCTDIDECSNKSYACNGGTCQNTNGGWDCMCAAGYQQRRSELGTNITCRDIDECRDESHRCTNGGRCVNSEGNWTCSCSSGFEMGYRNNSIIDCKDINECEHSGYSCNGSGDSAVCSNTFGGWSCGCKTGYTLVNNTQTNKSCIGGEYSYTCSMTLSVSGGNVNTTAIRITLQEKIEQLYVATLHEQTMWIEILGIKTQPSVRRKRETNSKLSVKYVVHTSQKRTQSQLIEVLNKSNVTNTFTFGNLTVQYDTVVNVSNSDLCSKCNNISTTCNTTDHSFTCSCKVGFIAKLDNHYECDDVDECSNNNRCWNGSHCVNKPGSFSCPCNDGLKLYQTSKETLCAEPCSMAKCHKTSNCTKFDNDDGYKCGCDVGRSGMYCENKEESSTKLCSMAKCHKTSNCTKFDNDDGYKCGCADGRSGMYCKNIEETSTSDKTVLIAVGSTLGGLVIVLCVVVFVVCRWRAAKIKEAEKMSMKYMDNSAFKDFENEYLTDQYMRKQNGSVYSHRISNGSFPTGNLPEGARGSYVHNSVNNPVYNKPQKLIKPQHRSSMPELEIGYHSTDRNGRQDSANHGRGQFSSLERGRYGNGVSHQYPNGYHRNGGNGRSSPEPDYEPRRSPRPDYRSHDSPNVSRDSGVGNGYHGNGFYDDDVHKGVHNGRVERRAQPAIRTSTKF